MQDNLIINDMQDNLIINDMHGNLVSNHTRDNLITNLYIWGWSEIFCVCMLHVFMLVNENLQ